MPHGSRLCFGTIAWLQILSLGEGRGFVLGEFRCKLFAKFADDCTHSFVRVFDEEDGCQKDLSVRIQRMLQLLMDCRLCRLR